jgi:hypothetical protein
MENPKSNKDQGQGPGCVTDQPGVGPLDARKSITREEPQAEATRRWRREGIAEQVAVFRDRARGEYLDEHPGCKKRDAHEHAWRRALAEFPPPDGAYRPAPDPEPVAAVEVEPAVVVESGVSGLGRIPDRWPQLPSNASLQSEIAWVQASRLDVVEEGLNGSTVVDLALADSPAPSKAAIGWLETSIRAYSKYCDIAAKATATAEHEQEAVRRERLALADVLVLIGGEA